MAEAIGAEARLATAGQRPAKLHALTSLRFFAAVFVVFYHAVWSFFPSLKHASLVGRLFETGFVSVSFFFLLSGYILGVVYLRGRTSMSRPAFFRARFARVYPLFFLTLVLDTPNLLRARIVAYGLKAAVGKTAITFVGNALMLQAWVLIFRGIDNPNWSLSVETLFYLSFPFLGPWLWRLRGTGLWLAAVLLYAAGQGVVWIAAPHLPADYGKFLPLLHLSTFALGVLLARWQTLRSEDKRHSSGRAAAAVFLASLACFCAVVYWLPLIPNSSLYDGLLAPVFAGVIWSFSHSRWLPAQWLGARWLVVLGEASFGLYLIHIPVLHLFEFLHWDSAAPLFPVFLAVSIGLSVLSFYSFETPVRKWVLKRGERHVKETMEMASDAQ